MQEAGEEKRRGVKRGCEGVFMSKIGKGEKVTLAVGSANPNKVRGIRKAAARLFGATGAKVIGMDVDSGVSDQPFNEETIKGATNRARKIAAKVKADYAIGLESGIFELGGRYFDVQWCAVLHEGKVHLGCSMGFEIPRAQAERLKRHKITLSELYDELTGDRDIGKKEGVINYLSRGVLKRSEMTEQAFLCAMIPVMKKFRK
ncbi:Non-canonical purine NTP phosphatase [Candidatus Burarchaeum australiense]|nr:Non-canonical purine NTP phosphatase [Candidatus Burarchaeum australiense]